MKVIVKIKYERTLINCLSVVSGLDSIAEFSEGCNCVSPLSHGSVSVCTASERGHMLNFSQTLERLISVI